jgi:hypothetical protein
VEIATALRRDIRVIPILIDGAELPDASDLPQEVAPLARRNARQVSFESFHSDVDSFIRVLERILAGPTAKPQSIAQAINEQREQGSAAPVETVLPFTLSLQTLGGVATPLIRRGSALPAEAAQTFSTAADNQNSVEINLFAGERKQATDNTPLGTFQLDQIAEGRRGVPQISLRATVDPNLVLVVTAEDLKSGRKKVLDAVDLTKIQVAPAAMEPDSGARSNDKPDFKDIFAQFFSQAGEPSTERSLDLERRLTLSKEEAESGSTQKVDSPSGPVTVTIPPGIKSGSKLRVRGVGLKKDGKRGDIYIGITVSS